jgi:putative ABC transport system substrate-binding protein
LAQQQPQQRPRPQRLRRVAVFFFGTPANSSRRRDAFFKGMQELGYVDGVHVRYNLLYGNGQPDLIKGFADDLRRDAPDAIVAFSTINVNAMKDEGVSSPVVMVAVDDPLRAGFVQDMSHPGMNFTGLTTNVVAQAPRLVDLLHEAIPRVGTVGMLASPASSTYRLFRSRVEEQATRRGLRMMAFDAVTPQEIERALATVPAGVGGLVVTNDATYYNERRRIAEIAIERNLPAIYPRLGHVEVGGLMSYGPNEEYLATRAAGFVARILDGDSPADMPIEGPSRYELGVSRKAAQAIGLALPQSFLQKADRII